MNTLWFPVLSDRFPGSRRSISISSGSSPSSESRGSPGFLVLVAFVVPLKMNEYKPGNETLSTSVGRRPFFFSSPQSPCDTKRTHLSREELLWLKWVAKRKWPSITLAAFNLIVSAIKRMFYRCFLSQGLVLHCYAAYISKNTVFTLG